MKTKLFLFLLATIISLNTGCAGSKGNVVKVVKPKFRFTPFNPAKDKYKKRTKTVRYKSL